MSDETDHTPLGEEHAEPDEIPQEEKGLDRTIRLDLPVISDWAAAQQERLLNFLGTFFARRGGSVDRFSAQAMMPVVDRLAGIGAGLVAMIIVDRNYGPAGLGMFAWFFSLLAMAGYLGRFGIPIYVENRIAREPEAAAEIGANALAALLVLGGAAIGLGTLYAFLLSGPGPGAADNLLILLLGPTIFFQNINALRLAMLNAAGRHDLAAGLKIRQRIVFLAATLVLCWGQVPLPLVAGAFCISQVVMLVMGRKAMRLPAIGRVLAGVKQIRPMLENSRAFLFTDNLLDVVFYLDMIILGWFVNPFELGIYARALILARLFLVVPGGLRPVFRKMVNTIVQEGPEARLQRFMARVSRWFFLAHGLLALFILTHFQQVLDMVFGAQQWAADAFTVFALVVPGLIFYSAVMALEPVFEARQQQAALRRLTLTVAAVNLILNINLIPFAGIHGAAAATAIATGAHFLLFCRMLPADLREFRFFWPGAAAALYLAYVLMAWAGIGMLLWMLAAPLVLGGLLWLTGFFEAAESRAVG